MKCALAALVAAALLGCGGDEVRFDLENPPQWLQDLDRALPATPLRPDELSSDCLASFPVRCTAQVRPSRAMARKVTFALARGSEARLTYTAGEGANPVIITLKPNKAATVPLRRSGGTLTFVCKSINRCGVGMGR